MRKFFVGLLLVLLVCAIALGNVWVRNGQAPAWPFGRRLVVQRLPFAHDQDGDGIDDLWDIYLGAKAEVQRKPVYKDGYYRGGFPPETEGVCTDVIWRALRDAGYDLKSMVDEDIKLNTDLYPRVNGSPEPNIDFRRAQNLVVFFNRYAQVLTTDVKIGRAHV